MISKGKKDGLKHYKSFVEKSLLTNRKIGELIGGISYAAISKAYHRFDIKVKGDKSLVKVIKKLKDRISYV